MGKKKTDDKEMDALHRKAEQGDVEAQKNLSNRARAQRTR